MILASAIAAYALALGLGAAIRTPGRVMADVPHHPDAVPIAVESNGLHTALIVPRRAAGIDFDQLLRPGDLGDPAAPGDHVSIGWGHAGFYRHAPTWADARAVDIASALLGVGDSAMHLERRWLPAREDRWRRRLWLAPDDYRRMAAAILRTPRRDAAGQPIPEPGHRDTDAFYAAHGRYLALGWSCNNWTAAMLRAGGVSTGLWTPTADGVMGPLRDAPARETMRRVHERQDRDVKGIAMPQGPVPARQGSGLSERPRRDG